MGEQRGNERDASILIVDDDPIAIRTLRQALEAYPRVRFATSGEGALELVRTTPPDIILLDAEMPGGHGFEACRVLQADERWRDIPIIFITAHSNPEFETEALTLGAADFISKPSSPAIVALRVRLHLQLKQQMDALRLLASEDGLTKLLNRRGFDDALLREVKRAQRSHTSLCLVLCDVDYFKRYNDAYGHPMGDQCLQQVAEALRESVREATDQVARYGGEELAMILPSATAVQAKVVAERVRTALARRAIPHAASEVSSSITLSMGVSCFVPLGPSQQGDDPVARAAQLTRGADQALYEAKRQGRDRVVVSRPTRGDASPEPSHAHP